MQASMKARRHKLGISRMSRSSSPVCGSLLQSAQASPSASGWTKHWQLEIVYLLRRKSGTCCLRATTRCFVARMTNPSCLE